MITPIQKATLPTMARDKIQQQIWKDKLPVKGGSDMEPWPGPGATAPQPDLSTGHPHGVCAVRMCQEAWHHKKVTYQQAGLERKTDDVIQQWWDWGSQLGK